MDAQALAAWGTAAIVWGVLLGVAFLSYRLLYRRALKAELVTSDNPATALHFAGHMGAVLVLAMVGCRRFAALEAIVPFLAGLALLGVAGILEHVLPTAPRRSRAGYLEERLVGPAVGSAGFRTGVMLLFSGAIDGEGGGWGAVALYVALGFLFYVGAHALYWKAVGIRVRDELEAGNPAVGIFSGALWLSAGLLLFESARGDFSGWRSDLLLYLAHLAGGLAFVPLAFTLLVRAVFRGHSLEAEIARDRNWGFALLAGCTLLAATFVYLKAFP